MRKLYLFVFILLMPALLHAQQWNRSKAIAGGKFFDVIRAGNDLLAGTQDGLYRSADEGASWTKVNSSIDLLLAKVYSAYGQDKLFYKKQDTLYFFGGYELHRSADGGANWTKLNTPFTINYSTSFASTNQAIYCSVVPNSGPAEIRKSADGGVTWTLSDTTSQKLHLYGAGDTLFLWGYSGDIWSSNKRVNYLDAGGKIQPYETTGFPANSYITGFERVNGRLVAVVPDYGSASSIQGYRFYSNSNHTWTKTLDFKRDGILMQAQGMLYYAPQLTDSMAYTSDGLVWTKIQSASKHSFSKALSLNAGQVLFLEESSLYTAPSALSNFTKANAGFYFPSTMVIAKMSTNMYVAHEGMGVFYSEDNGASFTDITGAVSNTVSKLAICNSKVVAYNPTLYPGSKAFVFSPQTSVWDSLALPANNGYQQARIVAVTGTTILLHLHEKISTNVYEHKYYATTDMGATWTNITSLIPSNALAYGEFYAGSNGELFIRNEFWSNNGKVLEFYISRTTTPSFSAVGFNMNQNTWYMNVSYHNGEFFVLKNMHNAPDSLYLTNADSLKFFKKISYGNFRFYNKPMGDGGLIVMGDTFYSIGVDSTNQDLTLIRSLDGGTSWHVFTDGFASRTTPNQLLHDGNDLWVAANNGLWNYGISTYAAHTGPPTKPDIRLYPNPCRDYIQVDLGAVGKDVLVRIYDMNGRLLFQQEAINAVMRIDTENYPRGMYLFQVVGAEVITRKFIVD
jgi:hypothetical protein